MAVPAPEDPAQSSWGPGLWPTSVSQDPTSVLGTNQLPTKKGGPALQLGCLCAEVNYTARTSQNVRVNQLLRLGRVQDM